MKVSAAKENILKKIRQALSHSTPLLPASEAMHYLLHLQDLDIEFAEQFGKLLEENFIFINHKEPCPTYKVDQP